MPFIEITLEDRVQMPEEIKEIRRTSLERTDFAKERDFDPKALDFDPKKYERKEAHYPQPNKALQLTAR